MSTAPQQTCDWPVYEAAHRYGQRAVPRYMALPFRPLRWGGNVDGARWDDGIILGRCMIEQDVAVESVPCIVWHAKAYFFAHMPLRWDEFGGEQHYTVIKLVDLGDRILAVSSRQAVADLRSIFKRRGAPWPDNVLKLTFERKVSDEGMMFYTVSCE